MRNTAGFDTFRRNCTFIAREIHHEIYIPNITSGIAKTIYIVNKNNEKRDKQHLVLMRTRQKKLKQNVTSGSMRFMTKSHTCLQELGSFYSWDQYMLNWDNARGIPDYDCWPSWYSVHKDCIQVEIYCIPGLLSFSCWVVQLIFWVLIVTELIASRGQSERYTHQFQRKFCYKSGKKIVGCRL